MYTKEQLRRLLIPLMFEQVLTALMGSVDTIMVTNIGSAAISAVSLVDSLNILIINIFAAMATGGAIICAQYLGSNQKDKANQALKQLIFFRNPYFTDYYHSLHSIQKTPIKPNLWIRRKKRDGQFIKLSFHNSPILSLHRTIQCRCRKLSNESKLKASHGHCVWL